jgi:antitoxin YefM
LSEYELQLDYCTRKLYIKIMEQLTYSKLRANLKAALDRAADNHEVIVVERVRGSDAVLMSREDYEALNETAYLLRSPANAKRLVAANRRAKSKQKSFATTKAVKHAVGL